MGRLTSGPRRRFHYTRVFGIHGPPGRHHLRHADHAGPVHWTAGAEWPRAACWHRVQRPHSTAEASTHIPRNPNARDSDDWLRLQSAQCVETRRSEGLATPSDAGVTCAAPTRVQEALYLVHSRCCTPRAQIPEPHVVVRWCISPDLGLRSAVVDARTSSSCSLVSVAVIAHPVRSGHFYIPRSTGTRHESLEACVRSTVSREASR
jgi:hypothetical protein